MGEFLLYGSYGYTGRLVARRALEAGLRPLLAGRDPGALEEQAEVLGLPWRAFGLEARPALEEALSRVGAVLHCAGPFRDTFRPMAEACLATGTHYLDITGEIEVFEALAGLHDRAVRAGVTLLPGVGFDVVPSDCLAGHLTRRLPGADRLRLGIRTLGGGISRGTALTAIDRLGRGGVVRKEGRLVKVPAAWKSRRIDFGDGPVPAVTIPWGDVATAWRSTGIGDIEVYAALAAPARWLLRAGRGLEGVLRSGPVRRLLERLVRRRDPGPDERERAAAETRIWGEVTDAGGSHAEALLRCPEGYTLTARAAVAAAGALLEGGVPPGFTTPSRAFGPDFVLGLEGVSRTDRG